MASRYGSSGLVLGDPQLPAQPAGDPAGDPEPQSAPVFERRLAARSLDVALVCRDPQPVVGNDERHLIGGLRRQFDRERDFGAPVIGVLDGVLTEFLQCRFERRTGGRDGSVGARMDTAASG